MTTASLECTFDTGCACSALCCMVRLHAATRRSSGKSKRMRGTASVSCVVIVCVLLKNLRRRGQRYEHFHSVVVLLHIRHAAANAPALRSHHARQVSWSRGRSRWKGCRDVENRYERRHHRPLRGEPNKRIVIVMHSTLCLMACARRGGSISVSARKMRNIAKCGCQLTWFSGQSNHLATSLKLWRCEEHRAPCLVTIFTPPIVAARRC